MFYNHNFIPECIRDLQWILTHSYHSSRWVCLSSQQFQQFLGQLTAESKKKVIKWRPSPLSWHKTGFMHYPDPGDLSCSILGQCHWDKWEDCKIFPPLRLIFFFSLRGGKGKCEDEENGGKRIRREKWEQTDAQQLRVCHISSTKAIRSF